MFVINTPNPNYNGTTFGVKFENGQAIVESEELRNILVNDYGYTSLIESTDKPEEKVSRKPQRQRKSSGK